MYSLENASNSSQGLLTSNGLSNGALVCEMESPHTLVTKCSTENSSIVYLSENDLKLFEHQVAGHGTLEKGLLKHKNGYVLKPMQPPPMGIREVSFYQNVHENRQQSQDDCYIKLKHFVPKYHGVACLTNNTTENSDTTQSQRQYLLLDDIIEGFKLPCVADVKIGPKTYSPDASEAKIKQEMSKYKGTKFPLGLSLTGMHHYDISKNEKEKVTREFCKSLDPSTLRIAMEKFFNKDNSTLFRTLVNQAVMKIRKIEQVFNVQTSFKLYGSSILIAYDADVFSNEAKSLQSGVNENGTPTAETSEHALPLRIYMIDFAHFHPSAEIEGESDSLDENYLFGLRNLVKMLCDIAETSDTTAHQIEPGQT